MLFGNCDQCYDASEHFGQWVGSQSVSTFDISFDNSSQIWLFDRTIVDSFFLKVALFGVKNDSFPEKF